MLRLPRRRPAPAPTDELGHLFVVTYGRSGSTLLMGLLDSLPGYCIRGENAGALSYLYSFHTAASKARDQWAEAAPGPSHPWYGIDGYPADVAIPRLRDLVTETVLRPPPGTTVTGFKEIRWHMAPPGEFLTFIENLFPGARFILNTRNHEKVLQSSWWKRNPDAGPSLSTLEERLKKAVLDRGERGYHLHFDDYVADPSRLEDLCRWLGAEYDAERFARVMSRKHTTGLSKPAGGSS